MAFDLKNYEDVQSRVKRWQDAFQLGRITTTIIEFNAEKGYVLVKAECYRDDITELPAGVDYAYGNVAFYPTHMKRFFIEDTTTSAIGRCISLVLPTELKSTAQDMARVEQPKAQPVDTTDYWATDSAGAETIGTAVEQLQGQLGGEILSESPICAHGHMILKEGVKNDKAWRGHMCPEKTKANQCSPIWYVLGSDGKWKQRM
jgi:hypothetical protein